MGDGVGNGAAIPCPPPHSPPLPPILHAIIRLAALLGQRSLGLLGVILSRGGGNEGVAVDELVDIDHLSIVQLVKALLLLVVGVESTIR